MIESDFEYVARVMREDGFYSLDPTSPAYVSMLLAYIREVRGERVIHTTYKRNVDDSE